MSSSTVSLERKGATRLEAEFYVEFYVWQKKQRPASLQAFDLYGAGTKSRTRDLLITSQLLYQLSYTGI